MPLPHPVGFPNLRPSLLMRLRALLFPERCEMCGRRLLADEEMVCLPCLRRFPATDHLRAPEDNVVAARFFGALHVERAAALWYYRPGSDFAHVILNMKYHGHVRNARLLGLMAAAQCAHAGFLDGVDALLPVPLHWRRRLKRGYNQCRKVAEAMREATGIPVLNGALCRVRHTDKQALKSHNERIDNVRGAFAVPRPELLAGKHVLLIDDVFTTGSTITECVAVLHAAAEVRVSVLALCYARQ